jgi:hypothetical protein
MLLEVKNIEKYYGNSNNLTNPGTEIKVYNTSDERKEHREVLRRHGRGGTHRGRG